MREYLIGSSMRLFVFLVGSIIWAGIWLTGFATVHWLLYAPPVFFLFRSRYWHLPRFYLFSSYFG
jgi:hypothetical protein